MTEIVTASAQSVGGADGVILIILVVGGWWIHSRLNAILDRIDRHEAHCHEREVHSTDHRARTEQRLAALESRIRKIEERLWEGK